jgi:hypothetical protein
MLYGGGEITYAACRRLAQHIQSRGYDGFIFTSFFSASGEPYSQERRSVRDAHQIRQRGGYIGEQGAD